MTDKKRTLIRIDCTAEPPKDTYFEYGPTHVLTTSAGTYREAEAVPLGRFGYRFDIEHIGAPHAAIIRYPDDKRRFMCVMDGTSYDLTTGVITDWAQPVSGKMLEMEVVFWPRWTDCSITFMTWGTGEPAAVSSIEIVELQDLAPLDLATDHNCRQVGIQYEDPGSAGCSEGSITHAEWRDRLAAYAQHTGQRLLKYTIVWYHGPCYPSSVEPSGMGEMVVARDRMQYSRYTSHPNDWVADTLDRLAESGVEFEACVTLLRLGSLMEKMNIDLDSIKAGAETINNMLYNDHVQAGTMDWTLPYNVINYPRMIDSDQNIFGGKEFDWAYGELAEEPYKPAPIFNPLHPTVQEAIIRLISEIATRYGKHPAFRGISLNMWHSTILWFGSIHSGYDDYSVSLFEKETGIKVPVDPTAPDRFSKRYEHLTFFCRNAWVEWRCLKIRELFRKLRDAVKAANPELRLTITAWAETTVQQVVGPIEESGQLYARPSLYDLYKDGGFDIAMFENEPGIEIDVQFDSSRDRGSNEEKAIGAGGVNMPLEKCSQFRDHDFLDSRTLDAIHSVSKSGAFIFNNWVEAWGKHSWFSADPGDPNIAELGIMNGEPAEGVFRCNSEYPPDGFWWPSQLRITPSMPAGDHFLELYAHSVAELDALRITRGGLILDTAHTDQIRQFSKAYSVLPAQKFETVGDKTDPIAVRTLVVGDSRYLYSVNREYYPVPVTLAFEGSAAGAVDLASGEAMPASAQWSLTLGPYELRSFKMPAAVRIASFTAAPPESVAAELKKSAREAFAAMDAVQARGRHVTGMDKLRSGMEAALAEGRLAWLRRALTSYIVRKCMQIAAEPA